VIGCRIRFVAFCPRSRYVSGQDTPTFFWRQPLAVTPLFRSSLPEDCLLNFLNLSLSFSFSAAESSLPLTDSRTFLRRDL